jgi:pimeloyl-ACP methyl ester carboxylesterase
MTAPARPILRNSILAAGTGTPVLLLHGSASSAAMWTPLINILKSRFRVLAPDLIGYGRTDPWPDGQDFSLQDEVDLIAPLIASADGGAHVVAHSYGGVIALRLARSDRVALRSLTLIEPVEFVILRDGGEPEAWSEADTFRSNYVTRIAAGDTEAALHDFVDYWSGAGAWDAMDEPGRVAMRRSIAKLMLDFHATFADPGPDAWRDIAVPVRLLTGDRSPLTVRRIAARLARRLPSATLRVVAGANHFLPTTHHAMLGALLLEELRD